ncbi:sigma-70 family RNA polymerase sigma factor [Abyssisolibacter fermentans]|uniref:sigma-70 family RNA polymerase sigma factor n=1 Tax=Abyssisolibacter fermentans TaxID=1766203 RepID=UPI00082ACBE0|nr:sigma-70 family RNA polymerase sigma factor [Abyssisolibacter fermentans]
MSTYKKNYLILVDYIKMNQDNFYRLAYSYVKNKEAALDIVQESIYKALKSVETIRNSSYIKTWMYRVIVNTSISYIRKNKKEILKDEICDITEPETVSLADKIDLYNAIDLLDEIHKTVIILRYFEDMKIEDIAKVTDCNINTVKTRIYSAVSKLRIILKEREYYGSEI